MNIDVLTDRDFEELLEATKVVYPRAVQRMWDARRAEMIRWAIEEKKFNPKSAPKFVDNFIKSMVFVAEAEASCAVKDMRERRQAGKL